MYIFSKINNKIKKLFFVVFIFFVLSITNIFVLAQSSLNFANHLKINDKDVKVGSIVVTSKKGFVKSKKEYSPSIVGVVVGEAGIVFESLEADIEEGYYPVVFSGIAEVLVSGENGDIKKGDFITTSNIPGVGMKATKSGHMLGIALADFKPKSSDEVVLLPVNLNIKYVSFDRSLFSKSIIDKRFFVNFPFESILRFILGFILGVGVLLFFKNIYISFLTKIKNRYKKTKKNFS